MSMISAQCGKLRERAATLRQGRWSDGEDDATLMEHAADTIFELRELCRDLFDRLMDKDEHCGECRSECEYDAWNFGDPKCVYAKRMRELGIKVEK